MVLAMPRVTRIAAVAAVAVALTAVVAATQAPASHVAMHEAAAGRPATAPVTVAVQPEAIRLPGAAAQAPPTTAECKRSDGIACYQPGQLRTAYHLPAVYAKGIPGKGATIAIVDPFGSPTIKSDLATFDKQFGYPAPPEFTIITPAGAIPKFSPSNTSMVSWAGETTLDVEYAHALAPGASILLVETPASENEGTSGFPGIVRAEEYVVNHGLASVISQSFGATEETFASYKQLGPLRAAYLDAESHHVTVLAASGDEGATDFKSNGSDYYTRRVTSWPDSDPLVTAVGGTRLEQTGGSYTSVAWNDTYNNAFYAFWGSPDPSPYASGGGRSEFFARPAYQNAVKAVTLGQRGVPDIAMSAACNGAVSVYGSYQADQAGWSLTCGTSEATPEFAAIVALADQVAGRPLGLINPTLYALLARHASGLVDVTLGNNTVSFYQGTSVKPDKVTGFDARKGYDLVTGVGTVNAASFVYELAGVAS
jgi:subtilase family serine protease